MSKLVTPSPTSDPIRIGEIVQADGSDVPAQLKSKYFRVLGIDPDGHVRLSVPYNDPEATSPYYTVATIHG